MDITKRIIEIRDAKKISPSDIADKIGIERPNYYRLEKRGEKLTIEQLKQIANALGVGINELLDIEVQNTDNQRVNELEKRVLELEDRVKDKSHIIDNFEKADDKIKSDLFGLFIYLHDLEIQSAYAKNFEVINENVYINGKLEEFAVHTYIKNENERREIIQENFLNEPIIRWLIDFLILHGYTDPEVLFWKKCLEEYNLTKREINLDFSDFKFPNYKKIIADFKKKTNKKSK